MQQGKFFMNSRICAIAAGFKAWSGREPGRRAPARANATAALAWDILQAHSDGSRISLKSLTINTLHGQKSPVCAPIWAKRFYLDSTEIRKNVRLHRDKCHFDAGLQHPQTVT
jgi:hypothetical protein